MKVTIENHDGRLRLRWRHEGKRYTLSCGVPDTQTGRAAAKQKAAQIELDISAGYFDPTLMKYRPKLLGKNAIEIATVVMFQRFAQYKLKNNHVLPQSLKSRYNPVLRYLEKYLNCPAHEVTEARARNFKAVLLENLTPQTAKERLWLLKSCWEWGQGKYHLAKDNPWNGLTSGIKGQPSQRVKPFTSAEITAILGAFRSHRYYSHYADFVAFLFGTGVRFGEAAGLQWKHIADDFSTVWITESVSRGHRKCTKTGKSRHVVLSPVIQGMLRNRVRGDGLVFPSPKGLPIDDHNFRNRIWKTVLAECNIEYRKPYNTRHSAISHALANGANPIALAEQTGHDKRVLLATYAHAIERQGLFVEF